MWIIRFDMAQNFNFIHYTPSDPYTLNKISTSSTLHKLPISTKSQTPHPWRLSNITGATNDLGSDASASSAKNIILIHDDWPAHNDSQSAKLGCRPRTTVVCALLSGDQTLGSLPRTFEAYRVIPEEVHHAAAPSHDQGQAAVEAHLWAEQHRPLQPVLQVAWTHHDQGELQEVLVQSEDWGSVREDRIELV